MPGISPAQAQLTCFIDDFIVLISFSKLDQPPNHPTIKDRFQTSKLYIQYIAQAIHTLSTILTISWKQSLQPSCYYLSEWLRHLRYILHPAKLGSYVQNTSKNQNTNVFKNHKTAIYGCFHKWWYPQNTTK